MIDANTGIKVRTHHPHYVRIARLKQQLLISHDVPDVFDAPECFDRMIESNEVVGFAATKGGLQSNDGTAGWLLARKAAENFGKQRFESGRGVGVLKKEIRLEIDRITFCQHHIF